MKAMELVCEESPLPPEVEDLLARQDVGGTRTPAPRFASSCGYAVVAANGSSPALLFALSAGSAQDPIVLDIPRSRRVEVGDASYPPALQIWPASGSQHGHGEETPPSAVGVAALSRDGVLRVYEHIEAEGLLKHGVPGVKQSCSEIRLEGSLSEATGFDSADSEPCVCEGLAYVPGSSSVPSSLVALGSQGSAVRIDLVEGTLRVQAMRRIATDEIAQETSQSTTSGFGSRIFSALRAGLISSVLNDGGGKADPHATELVAVSCSDGAQGSVVSIRRGGRLEKWSRDRLFWACEVTLLTRAYLPSGATDVRVSHAFVSSEQILVALVTYKEEETLMACVFGIDVQDDYSHADQPCLYIDFGAIHCEVDDIHAVLSHDVLYSSFGSEGVVLCTSVARDVPEIGQVHGQVDLGYGGCTIGALDAAAESINPLRPDGGKAVFLESRRLVVLSNAVPAPVSSSGVTFWKRRYALSSRANPAEAVGNDMMWRAFLQYAGGQQDACSFSLRTLTALFRDETGKLFDTALGAAALRASTRIVDDEGTQSSNGTGILLIDDQLEARRKRMQPFVAFLADPSILRDCEYANHKPDDRLWDIISRPARASVVSGAEKLNAALALRRVQNMVAFGPIASRPTKADESEDAPMDAAARELVFESHAPSANRSHGATDHVSFIDEAIRIAGTSGSATGDEVPRERRSDASVALYTKVSEFDKFLPCMHHVVRQHFAKAAESTANARDESDPTAEFGGSWVVRELVLASDACVEVTKSALEMRETLQASHSFATSSMEPRGGWSCDVGRSRATMHTLMDYILRLCNVVDLGKRKVLLASLVNLADAVLQCAQADFSETNSSGDPELPGKEVPLKRRKVDITASAEKPWEAERTFVLAKLGDASLESAAFRLAKRYEDFGTMLALKIRSPTFDRVFAEAVRDFGRDFAFFGFRWLEARGEIKLLVYGSESGDQAARQSMSQTAGSAPTTRSASVKSLLHEYFGKDRAGHTNLSWMAHLAGDRFDLAAKDLAQQATLLGVPEKEHSVPNSKVLLSVGKLAALAASGTSRDGARRNSGRASGGQVEPTPQIAPLMRDIEDRLGLIDAQLRLSGATEQETEHIHDALLGTEDLVRRFMEDATADSTSLVRNAAIAVGIIENSALESQTARRLKQHVVRRLIERQDHIWLRLADPSRPGTDDELRLDLQKTALFEALKDQPTLSGETKLLIDGGDILASLSSAAVSHRITTLLSVAVQLAGASS